jgi:hypothetical protein
LRDVEVAPTYRQPTLDERIAAAFKSPQSIQERLETKLRDAELGYQRVLALVTAPDSVACRQFYSLIYDSNQRDALRALSDYLLLPVGGGSNDQTDPIREIASLLALPPPEPHGLLLIVLDEQGQVAAQTTDAQLGSNGTIDRTKLTAFLQEHALVPPDAEQILANGLAEAAREQKRVLVQQSGAFCGPCILLSRFLDQHQALFAKDYVYIKLDSRFKNGPDVLQRLRKEPWGIPWMVILEPDGQPLINSTAADGNIGFPSTPGGIQHFEKMLRTTARRMTDAEINSLIDDLHNSAKARTAVGKAAAK